MSIDIRQYKQQTGLKKGKKLAETSSEEGQGPSILNREINLFGTGLSIRKKEAFFMEFGVLLRAGLDFKTALELVTESLKKEDKGGLFTRMKEAIVGGASLSEALEQSGKFSAYDIYSVRIAEESGKLEYVLGELASFYNKSQQHRRMLTSALSYPSIVVLTAVLALSFLLNFLVPMFSDVYKRLNQDLPAITRFIVNASNVFSTYFGKAVLAAFLVVAALFFQRKKAWFRRCMAWLLLRIPVIGHLVKMLFLTRFCSAMAFLIGSKVPVLDALSLVQKMVGFYPLETALTSIQAQVMKGQPLYASMEAFPFFPKRMTALIKVGEEVNRLDQMFEKLAVQYNEESEHRIKGLGSLIEPVLIVFLAIVVGVVLVAMYLPIFKLVTNFNG
jgi:type IV pilus assembly protein PilC